MSNNDEIYQLLQQLAHKNVRDPTIFDHKKIVLCDALTWKEIRYVPKPPPRRSLLPKVPIDYADPPFANRHATEIIKENGRKIEKYGDIYPFRELLLIYPPPRFPRTRRICQND